MFVPLPSSLSSVLSVSPWASWWHYGAIGPTSWWDYGAIGPTSWWDYGAIGPTSWWDYGAIWPTSNLTKHKAGRGNTKWQSIIHIHITI